MYPREILRARSIVFHHKLLFKNRRTPPKIPTYFFVTSYSFFLPVTTFAANVLNAACCSFKPLLYLFVIINALLFTATASTINILTTLLSPVALAIVTFYSYCKRFTSLAHLVLGLSLGIAPVGAYIAVTGEFALAPCILAVLVITWCGGFDIIYALQDAAFDRERGLHSIPSRFSARTALLFSLLLHVVSVGALLWFCSYLPGRWYMWVGVAIFIILLALQHLLVTPTKQKNIGIAFGTLNGLASLTLAIFVILDLLL